MKEWCVVMLAPRSQAVSSVFGPMTRAQAEALNDALWRHFGNDCIGGIHRLSKPLALDEPFFIGGLCVYDPPRKGMAPLT